MAYLRYICGKEGIDTEDGEGKNIGRPNLETALAAALEKKLPSFSIKRQKKEKSFNEKVKMNLHRLNQLFFFLFFVWDGAKWGGMSVRGAVITACKVKYGDDKSDEEAVRAASAASSYFAGLWSFFDVELRMCVEPFMDWERGSIVMFLRLFPLMCMYVASSHKTKVPKVFLMLAERLLLYVTKHKNVVKLFAANCRQFDEEKIEFMNASVGRAVKARIKDLNISHYIRATCIMKCIKDIHSSFSKLFNRKEQENENERLRVMYTKQRWDATRASAAEWVSGKFQSALDGDFEDALWPRANPFEFGLMRIRTKFGPEQKVWDAQQRRLGPDDGSDDDGDDDDDSDGDDDDDEEEEEEDDDEDGMDEVGEE